MAAILAARKLAQYDGVATSRVPATISAVGNAISWAGEIMKKIDERDLAGTGEKNRR